MLNVDDSSIILTFKHALERVIFRRMLHYIYMLT